MTSCTFALVFAIALAASLAATFPLRAALAFTDASELGLSAREVTGTVWSGGLRDTKFHGVEIGDVSARLDPKSLFTGNPRFVAESAQGRMILDLREGVSIVSAEGQPS